MADKQILLVEDKGSDRLSTRRALLLQRATAVAWPEGL